MHELAQKVYAEVGGSVKHLASYEALLSALVALPRSMMPTRFDTEDVTPEGTELTRHEIALVDLRVADGPIHIETDGTETSVTPQMARTRNLTYEIRLYGTFVYTVSSGIAPVFTTFALVDGEVAYTFRSRRSRADRRDEVDAVEAGEAGEAGEAEAGEGDRRAEVEAGDAGDADEAIETDRSARGAVAASEAGSDDDPMVEGEEVMYIRGADDVERCVSAEVTCAHARFDSAVASAFARAAETR